MAALHSDAFVFFGATGDLAYKKIFPSLQAMIRRGHLTIPVIGVAKAGLEAGVDQIGGSCIIAPTGEVVAQAVTEDDELVVARCDLDLGNSYKNSTFNFAKHREPQTYGMIVERKGAVIA